MRKQITYKGHVQGVGFRYCAKNIAQGYEIDGYVKNLNNGGVEIQAEGEKEEIELFFAELNTEMAGFIREKEEIEISSEPALRGGFSIAH
jgi:acylphosphatase